MTFPIRLAAEPSNVPEAVWVRLHTMSDSDHGEYLDACARNFTGPVAVTDLEAMCDIPTSGQPARGWCHLVQVRPTNDGRLGLWGLVSFIDQELSAPAQQGSLWACVTITPNAVAPVSGEFLGPKLMAIELAPSPFPQPTDDPQALLARKEVPMTATVSPHVETLLNALPRFRAQAPNNAVALEQAAVECLPEVVKGMSRERMFFDLIHPALAQLELERFKGAARVRPVRASLATEKPTEQSKLVLCVSTCEGRNRFEKLMSHIQKQHPELNRDGCHRLASEMSQTHRIEG